MNNINATATANPLTAGPSTPTTVQLAAIPTIPLAVIKQQARFLAQGHERPEEYVRFLQFIEDREQDDRITILCATRLDAIEAPWRQVIEEPQNPIDNPVHPLVAHRKFGIMNDVYQKNLPALRLVSLWLTHPSFSGFFELLATARVRIHADAAIGPYFEPQQDALTPEQQTLAIEKMFADLEELISFEFYGGWRPENMETLDESYACCQFRANLPSIVISMKRTPFEKVMEFEPIISAYWALQYQNAKTIIHETAHALAILAMFRSTTQSPTTPWGADPTMARDWSQFHAVIDGVSWPVDFAEPRLSINEQFCEMGWSLERYIEGAGIAMRSHKNEISFSFINAHKRNFHWVGPRFRPKNYLASPMWCRAWFEKETWTRIGAEGHGCMMAALRRQPWLRTIWDKPLRGFKQEMIVGADVGAVLVMCSIAGIDAAVKIWFEITDSNEG
ncbi:hypothetical protein CC80DRAFT_508203 [Byssothecium circinans]|uniref:Uncharacterized protein n=1 Tax=Byssothecium circinans TaxID=147558 RepID=A0A6A5TH90_9PLEO|nr:hypothetical protein CC80DRAFT_508203 [Byssothecium circinans]